MPRAQSRYKQVRVTITEEHGGRVSVRVMVKPMHESWTMKHTVWVHSFLQEEESVHWVDLVATAQDVILAEVLPPST